MAIPIPLRYIIKRVEGHKRLIEAVVFGLLVNLCPEKTGFECWL
jgi:hypothetical protein